MAEKILESYNEVFADIVNVLLFDGEQRIIPEDLVDQTPRTVYKADDQIRELERDVAKKWIRNNIRIACIGLENQTQPDRYMTLRVMGYDGVDYKTQLRNLKKGEKPSPVITLVLYFGYKKHWDAPRSLFEALEVPEDLKPFVNDARINLYEIAYLSREQVNMFRSDFRIVADYFVQMRETGEYAASSDQLQHMQEVLQLLNVMDEDHRFESYVNNAKLRREGVKTMSEWLTKVISESETRGRKEGRDEGLKEGRDEGRKEGRDEGRKEGLDEGRKEGRDEGRDEERLNSIQSIMNKLHYTAEMAMDILNIPHQEHAKYIALLREHSAEGN